MKYHARKMPFLAGGSILAIIGTFSVIYPQFSANTDSGIAYVGVFFLLVSCILFSKSYSSKNAELEIYPDSIIIRGKSFDRDNILSFRIAPITYRGGHSIYAILKFYNSPEYAFMWKTHKFFERIFFMIPGSPRSDNHGESLPSEPRLIIMLNFLAEDISRINNYYIECEQVSSSNH